MKVMTECFRAEISLFKADFQCPYIQMITHRLIDVFKSAQRGLLSSPVNSNSKIFLASRQANDSEESLSNILFQSGSFYVILLCNFTLNAFTINSLIGSCIITCRTYTKEMVLGSLNQ